LTALSGSSVNETELDLKESSVDWIQPCEENNYKLRWGFRNGMHIGLTPDVIRGLITIYTPYAGQPADRVINFIAIEPIPENETERGFSELEMSDLDHKRGKRIWSSDNEDNFEPKDGQQPAPGIIRKENGEETLTIFMIVEPFHNQARVYLKIKFYETKPHEVEITTCKRKDSKKIKHCIVTATMGNYARLRKLYLKDDVKTSSQIWPDYTEHAFTPHALVDKEQMITDKNGFPYFIAYPDEKNPSVAEYAEGTASHWKYEGKPATQYWYCKDPDNSLQGIVNGRIVYWASHDPIPGGVSFENFELKKDFRNGDRFVFGVTPFSPEEFVEIITK
jgi:hypothetical protein